MDLNFEYYKGVLLRLEIRQPHRAANVLMTSQPAVTRTIHNLESELGCRLFIRSKKGVELTPEGRVFYEYISAACAQIFKGRTSLPAWWGWKTAPSASAPRRRLCTAACSRRWSSSPRSTPRCALSFSTTARRPLSKP